MSVHGTKKGNNWPVKQWKNQLLNNVCNIFSIKVNTVCQNINLKSPVLYLWCLCLLCDAERLFEYPTSYTITVQLIVWYPPISILRWTYQLQVHKVQALHKSICINWKLSLYKFAGKLLAKTSTIFISQTDYSERSVNSWMYPFKISLQIFFDWINRYSFQINPRVQQSISNYFSLQLQNNCN